MWGGGIQEARTYIQRELKEALIVMVPPSLELNSTKKTFNILYISREKLMFIPIDVYNLLCNHFHILKIEGGFVYVL